MLKKLKLISKWLALNAIGLLIVAGMTAIVIAGFLHGLVTGLIFLGFAFLILAIILAIPNTGER